MDLLREEIRIELKYLPAGTFPEVEKLEIGKFDSAVYDSTGNFLRKLSTFYQRRISRASNEREALKASRTVTDEDLREFELMRERYVNNFVSDMVKNSVDPTRIVEWNGQLIQKLYPIYIDDTRPTNPLDFRAPFYSPVKYFFGRYWDTLYFNVSVIWLMTILFYITLYFDVLKRIVNSVEMYKKYSRRLVRN